jgi:hypothetical protein
MQGARSSAVPSASLRLGQPRVLVEPDAAFDPAAQRLDERVAQQATDGRPHIGTGVFDAALEGDARGDLILVAVRMKCDAPAANARPRSGGTTELRHHVPTEEIALVE